MRDKKVIFSARGANGFGFVLRGAKNDGPIAEFTPSPAFPAVQYLESVDPSGPAYEAGLKDGDFIIEVKTNFQSGYFFNS